MMHFAVLALAVSILCVWSSGEARIIKMDRTFLAAPSRSTILAQRNHAHGHVQPRGGDPNDHIEIKEEAEECTTYPVSPGDTFMIRSKGFPEEKYPNNEKCIMKFIADPEAIFTVECPVFKLKNSADCVDDFLRIKFNDGEKNRFCGKTFVTQTGTTDALTIKFQTNEKKRDLGFSCIVTVTSIETTTPSTDSTTPPPPPPPTDPPTTPPPTDPPTTPPPTDPPTTPPPTDPPTTPPPTDPPTTPPPTTTSPPGSCGVCGKVNRATRIVGGVKTEVHEYPWQVGLAYAPDSPPFCGASIINSDWILTAAHCVEGTDPSSFMAVIGDHNWNTLSETPYTDYLSIEEVIVHNKFDSTTLNHDIALLRLTDPIVFPSDNMIAPICLPTDPDENYKNIDATVTGWGVLTEGGTQPNQLREVTVTTMTNGKCKNKYGTSAITSNMICAGEAAGGKDSCQGDSGGPLFTDGDASETFMVQIGIVSWGFGCAQPNYPGVYTRVTRYLDWIAEETDGSIFCPPPS